MSLEILLFAAPGDVLATATAALFGLLIGSFLNVVIYRMPVMMQRESDDYIASELGEDLPKFGKYLKWPHADRFNLVVPRSACPHCGHQIGALENIPVLSYLALRGKCRACKAPISKRYPTIELATAALSALLIWKFGSGWAGLATLVFAYLLIAMTAIDFDTQFLPDDLTYPLLWCGLLINIHGAFAPLPSAIIGAVAGYLTLWSVNYLYEQIKNTPGMGNGDFKLLAALGAWFGWTMLPTIILLSSIVGSIVGISLIVFAKHKRDVPIPFGPYLAGAGLIALLYGDPLMRMTHRLLG
ncbi:MAG: A24 family peptidase [Pseudomonadota bacterium]